MIAQSADSDASLVDHSATVSCRHNSSASTPQNISEALQYINSAAEKGSDVGAYNIGIAYANGLHGLTQDSKIGTFWLSKVIDGSCEVKHCGVNMVSNAKKELEYLRKFDEVAKEKIVVQNSKLRVNKNYVLVE